MLATDSKLVNPVNPDQDLQFHTQTDSQVIQEYQDIYLQIAPKAKKFLSMPIDFNFDSLYELGCDNPSESQAIEDIVSYELRLCGYSKAEQVDILFHGPYIQAQMDFHSLSESCARQLIRKNLNIAPATHFAA